MIYSLNNVENNPKYSENWPDLSPTRSDYAMGNLISDYWIAFAIAGNPNGEQRPDWKVFTQNHQHYLRFRDGKGLLSRELFPEAYELHQKIIQQRRHCGNQIWWFNNAGLLAPEIDKSGCPDSPILSELE